MKKLLIIILNILSTYLNSQSQEKNIIVRKGLVFGTACGLSHINLMYPLKSKKTETSISFPNFKVGTMISKRMALVLYLPGSIYTYTQSGRTRHRGFEAMVPSVQYWVKERWWLMAGAGLGMDAPAFYDIKNENERNFYFGSALIASTGYEILHKQKFAIDIQTRVHFGNLKLLEGSTKGLAFNFLIGFNWY